MKIKSNSKVYNVFFKDNVDFLNAVFETEHVQYVIDKNVFELYTDCFSMLPQERLMLIEATEQNKIIDTALQICEKMTEIPAKRNSVLISIGGGIIQDITGFVASILYRGIQWIFIPTTLLASCDSCIGGKTSLNYKTYKNLLGTFYPPDEIYICPQFFKTLSEKDYKSGLGEILKFNIMSGNSGITEIEGNIEKLLARDEVVINHFVENSLSFKKSFIEEDEFDQGERIKLNFAHTFGHAIEVISQYMIPHGTAVACGMVMANSISLVRGLVNNDFVKKSESILLKIIDINVDLLKVSYEQYIKIMQKDKKQTNSSLTAVLMTGMQERKELIIVRNLEEKEVKYAIDYFINFYKTQKEI